MKKMSDDVDGITFITRKVHKVMTKYLYGGRVYNRRNFKKEGPLKEEKEIQEGEKDDTPN